jgi:hypothetical protein
VGGREEELHAHSWVPVSNIWVLVLGMAFTGSVAYTVELHLGLALGGLHQRRRCWRVYIALRRLGSKYYHGHCYPVAVGVGSLSLGLSWRT